MKVVITGAGSGLGAATAKLLAKQGHDIVLVGKTEAKLKKVANELSVPYFVCDVRDRNECVATSAKIGELDALINAAGIWTETDMEASNPDLRREALLTNTLGTIEFSYAFLDQLKSAKRGKIVNIVSVSGTLDSRDSASGDWATYAASKWGVSGFTHALKEQLKETSVQVMGVYPGGFESDIFENARYEEAHNQPWMMQTDHVAEVVVYALTRPDDVYMEKIVFCRA